MKTRSVISTLVCLSLILLETALTEADVTQAARPPAAVPQSLPTFSQIAAGEYHTCAVTADGRVKCWGDNQSGQLGDGTTTNRSTPVDVSGLGSGVTALAAGGYHTCALMDAVHGGGVKCWGNNGGGQLGDGTTTDRSTPVDVSGLGSQVMGLVVGSGHTCALTTAGGAKCWGGNWYGQLGDGTNTDRSTPVNVSGLGSGVAMLAAGEYHSCALFTGGGVKCWGYNVHGQLGDGTTDVRYGPVAVIGLGSGVAMLMAGWERTCVLMDVAHGGGAKCWGWNFWGQLGDGTTTDSNTPVNAIWLGSGVTTVGQSHTCALMSAVNGGMLKCWGWNGSGQLGDGTTTYRLRPWAAVSGLDSNNVMGLAAGKSHTCALTTSGEVKCWGDNGSGQLGNGTIHQRNVPQDASGLGGRVTALATGGEHTCALTTSGGVKCWGYNEYGQLGNGTTQQSSTPVDVVWLGSGVTTVATGDWHTCALTTGGGAKCWGYNQYGQLGDGMTSLGRDLAVDVTGLGSGVMALALGASHTCALMDAVHGSGVKCWGNNGDGQLGDGTTTDRSLPVDVSGLGSGVTALAAGWYHTCALMDAVHGGGVKCWGANWYGQLGDGTTTSRLTPVNVSGLGSGGTALAAGGYQTCALVVSGGVRCWGRNEFGQLGDGTNTDRNLPVDVIGLESGATALAMGWSHTCALTDAVHSGGAKCWGYNGQGQLGDGTIQQRNTPVDVSGLGSGVTALAAGGSHTCALVGSGRPKCWGWDKYGQLGLGTIAQSLTPIDIIDNIPVQVAINYPTGLPGSYFTVTGENFPVSSTLTVTVNSAILTTTLRVNETGGFIFFVNTMGADAGSYTLTAGATSGLKSNIALAAVSNASAIFTLIPAAPLRIQEGGGSTISIPAGLAQPLTYLYLPLLKK